MSAQADHLALQKHELQALSVPPFAPALRPGGYVPYGQYMSTRTPEKVIRDNSTVELSFNVMPDRPVREKLTIKEYRLWHRYAEAVLDREYFSSMEKSPDHLIFLTGCAHSQKLLYVYLNHELGFDYVPHEKERVKYWPTHVDVKMPRMVRQNRDVVQKLSVTRIEWVDGKVAEIDFVSTFNDLVTIEAKGKIYLI